MTKFVANKCHSASIKMFFFHNHEKIQFAYKFRRNKFFDKYYSKTYFKTQNCKYF